MTEHAVTFECQGELLFGVLHEPAQAQTDLGIVIVVGGPQYRAGSHRQFVHLARALAGSGFPVLRFDCRGMGDSTGAPRAFEHLGEDIHSAIAQLRARMPSVRRVVLWGLCDGASAALLYARSYRDPVVKGLAMANPWVRSDATLARTHLRHYYWRRLLQGGFWRQRLRGKGWSTALRDFIGNWRTQRQSPMSDSDDHFVARMACGWRSFDGDILLILSTNDITANEFVETSRTTREWRGAMSHPRLTRCDLRGADHTFSSSEWRDEVSRATIAWLSQLARPATQQVHARA